MDNKNKLAFKKINYIIMLIGILFLTLGFFIMTLDSQDYGFGFLGITLGPIIVMIGFITQFAAIFYKSKK
jgi:fumarate reductase subunit C